MVRVEGVVQKPPCLADSSAGSDGEERLDICAGLVDPPELHQGCCARPEDAGVRRAVEVESPQGLLEATENVEDGSPQPVSTKTGWKGFAPAPIGSPNGGAQRGDMFAKALGCFDRVLVTVCFLRPRRAANFACDLLASANRTANFRLGSIASISRCPP